MRRWVKTSSGNIVEDNGDGTYTLWSYTVWGPLGQTGKLKPGIEVFPIKTKADREGVARIEAMIERAMQSQNALVTAMHFARGDKQR